MLKTNTACLVLGDRCNINCIYCIRKQEGFPPEDPWSSDMLDWLAGDNYNRLAFNGGEPLLYWNDIKDIMSLKPAHIQADLITNGTLLQQEVIDFVNEHRMWLLLSFDGPNTKLTRGVNVLEDERIRNLVKQANKLCILYCVTNLTYKIYEGYQYILDMLDGKPFRLNPEIVRATKHHPEILYNFPYEEYAEQLDLLSQNCMQYLAFFRTKYAFHGTMQSFFHRDGSITDVCNNYLGSIYDNYDALRTKEFSYSKKCQACDIRIQCAKYKCNPTEHECRIMRLFIDKHIVL